MANSDIMVNIPLWNYHFAIRPSTCGYGVIPHHEILDIPYTSLDEALEFALSMISK